MRIDGICTCVGELYAGYLRRTLPVWNATLDSLTVVTDWAFNDQLHRSMLHRPHGTMRETLVCASESFSKGGAYFNKGAALNVALGPLNSTNGPKDSPTDWILSLDADVLPPPNWRELAEPLLQPGNLYGCKRTGDPTGQAQPWGYFQLWHASDPHPPKPPFSEAYAHAGRYDVEFMHRWPQAKWVQLPFTVTHLGEPRTHWHGPGNDHMMGKLMRGGVGAYRERDERLTPSDG